MGPVLHSYAMNVHRKSSEVKHWTANTLFFGHNEVDLLIKNKPDSLCKGIFTHLILSLHVIAYSLQSQFLCKT